MNGYRMLFAVVERALEDDYTALFHKNGAALVFATLCEGAARQKNLDMLGLERKDKLLIGCVLPGGLVEQTLGLMKSELHIDVPNSGVAFTVDVQSVGGVSALRCLCSEEIILGQEGKSVKQTDYSLIVAIAEQGHTGAVMDAAREAGARGGTIIRAKGTQGECPAKFFGVSLAEEKELLYIVTAAERRQAVMASIMEKAGVRSPAHTILFSLPVEDVAGLRLD